MTMAIPHTVVRQRLEDLACTIGFGKPMSESETEWFNRLLLYATRDVAKQVVAAHKQGLCLDALSALAQRLPECLPFGESSEREK